MSPKHTPILIKKYPLISEQITQPRLEVVLSQLEKVLQIGVPGDVVEFGCYIGTTSLFIRRLLDVCGSDKAFHVYDSFEGLPPKTSQDESPAGLQFKAGELLATKKQLIKNLRQANVPMPVIKKGWFSDLTERNVPERIAFAFLDGDYYHSIRDPLMLIWNHMAPGAIIVVDDYANEALPGAAKAVDEWLHSHPAHLKVEHSLGIIHT